MNSEELRRALKLLFENFWILRSDGLENYNFLRRHQEALQKELRTRFGMNLLIRPQYIQLLKRPHHLAGWMGDIGFTSTLDYALFCCAMAYIEELEADSAFMLDDLIRNLEMLIPEEIVVDWRNYNHRKSLVRALKKMIELRLIENIQGEASGFEQSEVNQEVLFTTTVQARAFLVRAPQSYSQYADFSEYWADLQRSQTLEENQLLYQRLMMESNLERTAENEKDFIRLRNYFQPMKNYLEDNTFFHFELYRDYAALTLEQRDGWQEVFPSRQVIDEILIQLATLIRDQKQHVSTYGLLVFSKTQWQQLVAELQEKYQNYWSKEFSDMSLKQLGEVLLNRGQQWQLLTEEETQICFKPVFSRLIAEMRQEDE